MNITTRTSLVGFLLTLSALSTPTTATSASKQSATTNDPVPKTIEGRVSRLTAAIRERADELPTSAQLSPDQFVAIGFADGHGRQWANARRGGWGDGYGGSFANVHPWRNGWVDGGSFYNYRPGWINGSGFINRY